MDVSGNSSTCVQTITVQDVTSPTISCPIDVTISCDADNTPTGTGVATATNNCDPSPVISFSDVSTYDVNPLNLLHYNYVITRTWKAMDVSGNSSTCVQTITVQDVTSPTISCPIDVTISCDADNTQRAQEWPRLPITVTPHR